MNPSRRRFLTSAAVGLGLPWLSSMGRSVHAQEPETTPRFVGIYAPNGMYMPSWTPSETGAAFALPSLLQSLEPVREDVDVLSGLHNAAADIDTAGHHASGTAGFLTGRRAFRSESRLQLGVSLDTLLDPNALALGLEDGQSYGDCDNGFSCAYSRNVSWRDDATPRPKLVSPQAAFDTLFAGYDPTATVAQRDRRRVHRTSVLDAVGEQTRAMRRDLGRGDRMILDAYLEDVRALEQRIARDPATCAQGSQPPEPVDVEEHAATMIDLIVTALRCDATQAVTLMLDNSASNRVYPFLGVSRGHHELSHIAIGQGLTGDLEAIGAWQVGWFSLLIERLRDVPSGEATLLDETLVLLSSELSEGNTHSHEDLPTLLGGGRSLGREPGRHVSLEGADWGEFLLSLGRRLGLGIETFGENGSRVLEEV